MSTWVFDFALINAFPPPKLGSFPSGLGLPGGDMRIQCIFGKESQSMSTWVFDFVLMIFPPQIGVISLWFGSSRWRYGNPMYFWEGIPNYFHLTH